MTKYDVYPKNELSSIVSEPLVPYGASAEPEVQHEEGLYDHEDVFREFARRLNQRIGTDIPL